MVSFKPIIIYPAFFWGVYGSIHVAKRITETPNWSLRDNKFYFTRTTSLYFGIGAGIATITYLLDIGLPVQDNNLLLPIVAALNIITTGQIIGYTLHNTADLKFSWTDKTDYSHHTRSGSRLATIWMIIERFINRHFLLRITTYLVAGGVLMIPYLIGVLTGEFWWFGIGLGTALIGLVVPKPFTKSSSSNDTPAPDAPNIVYCMIDDLRRDHMSLHGYERTTTPNLSQLVEDSQTTIFESAISPGSRSADSIPSLLSGTYASQHQHGNNDTVRYLSEELSDEGYETCAISGNTYFNWYRYSNKFDSFSYFFTDKKYLFPIQKIIALLKSRVLDKCQPSEMSMIGGEFLTELAASFINGRSETERPFFLFLTYMDVHAPYIRNEQSVQKFANEHEIELSIPSTFQNNAQFDPATKQEEIAMELGYDESISYVDEQVSKLFNSTELTNLSNETIVIITSDHGEMLGEQGTWGHPPDPLNPVIEVPLLLYGSTETLPDRYSELYSTVYLPQLILDVANITPSQSFVEQQPGVSSDFSPLEASIPAVVDAYPLPGETLPSTHRLAIKDKWKLLDKSKQQYFEYSDAFFENPIGKTTIPNDIEVDLSRWLQEVEQKTPTRTDSQPEQSRALQQQLEDLGYL